MANKDKKNKTSFDFGNKAAEKWTLEDSENAFIDIFESAFLNDTILSIQSAYFEVNMLGSTFHYIMKKFPELERYKKDIQDVINARINDKALIGEFNATYSIWRNKQLGEIDKHEVKQEIKQETKVELSKEAKAKIREVLDDEY